MHRQQILVEVAEIATNFANSNNKVAATAALNSLKQRIMSSDPQNKRIAYFYGFLVDSDAFCQHTAAKGLLFAYSEALLQEIPALAQLVANMRALPDRLFKYLMHLEAPSLKERVATAQVTANDAWIDPITAKVMDYPVSYTIGDTQYTVDLFTLLNNSDESLGLCCPMTRQYIYLADLQPRLDIVEHIKLATWRLELKITADPSIQLQHALAYVRANNLAGLQQWRAKNPEINLDQEVTVDGSLLHTACRLGFFQIAIWLLKNGAFMTRENQHNLKPGQLIDVAKLKVALNIDPENPGLLFLMAMKHYALQYATVESRNTFEENLIKASEKKFVPAMLMRAALLFTYNQPGIFAVGVIVLRDAMQQGSVLAAIMLHELYKNSIKHKVATKQVLERNEGEELFIADNRIVSDSPINLIGLNEKTQVTPSTIAKDCISLLATDELTVQRYPLEHAAASMLLEAHHNKPAIKGYATTKALCMAYLAWTRTFKPEAMHLLLDLANALGYTQMENILKRNIINSMQEDVNLVHERKLVETTEQNGSKKPWVPYRRFFC